MRVGGRNDGGVLPRRAHEVYGNIRASTENTSTPNACRTGSCSEKDQERPSLATGLSKHEALFSEPRNHNAARWNTHFRFALKNGASLQCAFQREHNNPRKGDTSKKLMRGTFLNSFDTISTMILLKLFDNVPLLTQ